jgi:outer membrane protein TolC
MNQLGFKKEWIEDGGLCPVDPHTTSTLCLEVRQAYAELDRLRAEMERLTTHSCALESALFAKTSELYPDLRSELDRLRAEKAELVMAVRTFLDIDHSYQNLRIALAKAANETEGK